MMIEIFEKVCLVVWGLGALGAICLLPFAPKSWGGADPYP